MIFCDRLQTHGRIAGGIQRRHVAQLPVGGCRLAIQGLHLIIVFGQTIEEFLDRAVLQRLGHQAAYREVADTDFEPEFARKYGQLSRHVHARQVVTRIRFGIAVLLRDAHDLGERRRPVVDIEQVRQRARENAAHGADLVTGVDQVA